MSAADLAAVIVAVCSVAAVVLLAVGVTALVRTLRALREVAGLLRTEAVPVLEQRPRLAGQLVGEPRVTELGGSLAGALPDPLGAPAVAEAGVIGVPDPVAGAHGEGYLFINDYFQPSADEPWKG